MNRNILIVDDELSTLRLLGLIIKNTIGSEVIEAENGQAALNIIEKGKEEGDLPALILLDIMMPGMDGFELIKIVKADPLTRDIPVIFLTGLSDTKTLLEAFKLGASDYISKPFNDNELVARIRGQLKISTLSSQLKERESILNNSLQILTAESSDHFAELNDLIENCTNPELRDKLKTKRDALYGMVMKTIGSLDNRKRIYSLAEALKNLKLAEGELPPVENSRVKIEQTNPYLLYVETSRLVKNVLACLIKGALCGSHPEEPIILRLHRAEDQLILDIISRGRLDREDVCNIIDIRLKADILRKEGGNILVKGSNCDELVTTVVLPAFKIENLEESLTRLSHWFTIPLEEVKKRADSFSILLEDELEGATQEQLESALFTTTLDYYRKKKTAEKISY